MGNGIYGSAALDLADVEGSARAGWNPCVDKAHGAADQCVDGIGHAEVRPTVAAWAGDQSFKPARSESFCGHVIGAGAVKHYHGFQFPSVGIHNSPHAA